MDALLEAATAASKMDVAPDDDAAKDASPNPKAYNRKTRPTHTAYQKAVMTRYYEYNKLPDAKERAAIGQAVGLSARAVQVWFQNRRQRQKPTGPTGPAAATWVEMDTSRRLINPGPTPTQVEALGGIPPVAPGVVDTTAAPSPPAADAIVAAIQQQAAALQYSVPDPVQLERDRALATAIAHAKTVSDSAIPSGFVIESAPAPAAPPAQPAAIPAPHEVLQRAGLSVGDAYALAAAGAAAAPAVPPPPPPPPRLDPAQLIALDPASHQLELRAALMDAYAKIPGAQRFQLPGAELSGPAGPAMPDLSHAATLQRLLMQLPMPQGAVPAPTAEGLLAAAVLPAAPPQASSTPSPPVA